MPCIQKLAENPRKSIEQIVDLKNEEFEPLDLMDRVKLFTKIGTIPQPKEVKSIKFKQTRNITINDVTLPSKQKLLQITRQMFRLEVKSCENIFSSCLGDKEILMLLLFIFYSVVPQKLHGKPRKQIEDYL